jgi:hypothetical protein
MRALTWLPFIIPLPWMVGWYWRSLKRYIFSIGLFVALSCIGSPATARGM